MRRRILIAIAACFYYSGLVALANWWAGRAGQRLVILNYHRATGGSLRRHLLYLRRHYRILHVEAALEELYAHRKDGQRSRSRRRPLAVTFDDGYRDNYTYALELARTLQVPFTVYLVSGYVESGAYFWWGEGERLVQRTQVQEVTVEDRTYRLQNAEERAELAHLIDTRLRYAQSVAQRETFLVSMREKLAVPTTVLDEEEPALPLTWEQVQEMEASGWVSFGAHTMHHPILAYLTDPAEVCSEIAGCRATLERHLGHPVRSFAYPIGQFQHIGENVLQAVRDAGYAWALTTHYGFNTAQNDPLLLRRVEADVDQHWLVIAAEAAGLWGFFSRLRWLPLVRKHFTNSR